MSDTRRSARLYSVLAGSVTVLLILAIPLVATAVVKEEQPEDQQILGDERGLPDEARHLLRPGQEADNKKPRYVKGQLIVKYKDSLTECAHCLLEQRRSFQTALADRSDSLDRLHRQCRLRGAKHLFQERCGLTTAQAKQRSAGQVEAIKRKHPKRTARVPKDAVPPDLTNVYVLDVPEDTDIEGVVQRYAADPHVEYAHPNYLMEAYFVPNDPYYSSSGSWGQPYDDLWGLKKIQAAQAWDLSQGQGIVVAVVDTGLDDTHPDIVANVWTNPNEIPGNSLDDDNNGFVDDTRGWDFAANDNNPLDGHGHGTHVSGTIAAVGNNGLGIIGVAPQAKIMPVKGLDDTGSGDTEDLAAGIVYAAQNGADVINNSWGCGSPCPSNPVAEDAVRTANALGAVVVFAAGNSSRDITFYSPQNMTNPKPIIVAASTEQDTPAFFTNAGVGIDIAAPGSGSGSTNNDARRNILSLKSSNCQAAMCSGLVIGTNYVRQAGTSMAAPHAAGAAALVLANRPAFAPDEVRQVLRASADDVGAAGVDARTGAGRLQVARALTIPSVLRVQITGPTPNAVMSQRISTVPITGTASGPGFTQYALSYGRDREPETWIPISSSISAVSEGLLGTWNIETLPDGIYVLQVIAPTASGFMFHDAVQVLIERDPPTPIATHPTIQRDPAISGNFIVWTDAREILRRIYLYDVTTGTERRITTDPGDQELPAISGNRVVWQADGSGGRRYDIASLDLATNMQTRVTADAAFQFSPAISGDKIVWQDSRNGNYDIYLYDLATNTERRITTDLASQVLPDISGEQIVWEDSRHPSIFGGSTTEIYLFDPATNTERRITNNTSFEHDPSISGDKIVWEDNRNGNWDIYLYDLATNAERRITTRGSNARGPMISGNRIVWTDDRNGNLDIYLYDLSTNTERQIAPNFSDQYSPAISGSKITWVDVRGSSSDIYFINLNQNLNQPPVLNPIVSQTVDEGRLLSFQVSGSDPDGDALTYSADSLPPGASFDPSTKTFSWTPGFDQAGSYPVTFTASDGNLTDQETTTLTVLNVDRPPVLTALHDWVVEEGQVVAFTAQATDPDGDALTYAISGLPSGASFDTTTGAFTWTPSFTQAGSYAMLVAVSDGSLTASDGVFIVVQNVNQPPVLVPIGPQTVRVGQLLTLGLSASDPDGDPLTYTATGLPTGAAFEPATRIFRWTPAVSQVGTHPVTFAVSDGAAQDTEAVVCTVQALPAPDLLVTAVNGPATGTRGKAISVSATVLNQGLSTTRATYVGYYLSPDPVITAADRRLEVKQVGGLAMGASVVAVKTLKLPRVPPGTYYLGAIADDTNRLAEYDEQNNSRAGNAIVIK